ncbi:MAG TPA: hypothetical protein VKB56_09460 [Terriglobales bacterium]|nr:hypothetical protein [Terriglobales bacterium]
MAVEAAGKALPGRHYGKTEQILSDIAKYNRKVEKRIQIFRSHQEADEADAREEMEMTPEQRVRIALELRNRYYPDAIKQRLARVYRVVKLKRR